ncbi:MAG TPA: DNA polymerase III subunit gamma/tau [Candidatus Binatia bacterium]|nr:DNA polymerase III subunit gamma/tau [Candidatus Binatia bacterium]
MSYLVLARKWRPQNFEDVSGQSHITRTLQNAIRAGRIAHAYLFTGVRGVGKTTAARILAKALNCAKGPTPTPCNECVQCKEIIQGNCLDVIEIDGASNRGIDEVRQIIENVRYQPARCAFKIYIIDEVHQVTKDAFNALLKTLEEPPASVKFILATTEPHRLPETILSRCQRFDFRRISLKEIVQRLGDISAREGLTISQGALIAVAREADGSMRDAQSLLEQVLSCFGTEQATEVDETALQEVLGLAERRMLFEISASIIAGDGKRCLELVAQAAEQGRDLTRLSKDLVEHFRNLMVAQLCGQKKPKDLADQERAELLDLPDQEVIALGSQVANVSIDTLLDYFELMAAGEDEIARAANPRFILETLLVRLAMLPKTLPLSQLIERLTQLETRLVSEREAAPVGMKTLAPRLSSNVSPDPVEATTAPSSASAISQDKDQVWRTFVSFIGKEKKLLASHLESGSAVAIAPESLTIGIAEKHHLNYLQDLENMTLLRSFAKRFFSREMTIQLIQLDATPAKSQQQGSLASGESGSEIVKEALRIFGGSIKGVRTDKI